MCCFQERNTAERANLAKGDDIVAVPGMDCRGVASRRHVKGLTYRLDLNPAEGVGVEPISGQGSFQEFIRLLVAPATRPPKQRTLRCARTAPPASARGAAPTISSFTASASTVSAGTDD